MPVNACCRAESNVESSFKIPPPENADYDFSGEAGVTMKSQ